MDILNVAIIGCGRVAGHHVLAINKHEGLRLVSVCDSNINRLEAISLLFHDKSTKQVKSKG